jgi:hypothetical protein
VLLRETAGLACLPTSADAGCSSRVGADPFLKAGQSGTGWRHNCFLPPALSFSAVCALAARLQLTCRLMTVLSGHATAAPTARGMPAPMAPPAAPHSGTA